MTLIIVILLLLGYVVIATGHTTGVNKSAIAIFIGTVGWVVYICYGTDFVMQRHAEDYWTFLNGDLPSSEAVKYYIYNNVFLYYVGRAASIVMFLLATMSIVAEVRFRFQASVCDGGKQGVVDQFSKRHSGGLRGYPGYHVWTKRTYGNDKGFSSRGVGHSVRQ